MTKPGDVDATARLRERLLLYANQLDRLWGCEHSPNFDVWCSSCRDQIVADIRVIVSALRSTPQEGTEMTDEFAIQLVRALWRCDSHDQRAVLLQSAFKALRVTQEGTTDDLTRSVELAVNPPPQHAATDREDS